MANVGNSPPATTGLLTCSFAGFGRSQTWGGGRVGLYATELVPLLRERGIDLSASQVHRLVSGTPERLSLQVLAALCDILSCTPADLVSITAENAGVRRTATGDLPAPLTPTAEKLRPRPARILPGS